LQTPGHPLEPPPQEKVRPEFLHDQGVIESILSRVDPQPQQRLFEIGPGQGALTRGLSLHNGDALKFDLRTLRSDERKLRLVGNLPYNVSTTEIRSGSSNPADSTKKPRHHRN